MRDDLPSKTILVIDDEHAILDLLTAVLESQGYAVLTAAAGDRGLALAREHLPNLVILDVMMEGMDGAEVRSQLKDDPLTASIPVIYVTGLMSEGEDARRTGEDGDLMIAKPFDTKSLLDHIDHLT